jgi:sulfide:quinone oxidoreductase
MHELFVRRGVRDAIQLKIAIPGERPVPNPSVADGLERALEERGIELLRGVSITSIDAARRTAVHASGEHAFDMFVGVPVHVPPTVVRASGLAEKGFITPNPSTLETHVPGVYAVGDVTKIPVGEQAVPKAGAFAEDAARTVVSDILVKEGKLAELVKFRAKGACYFELSEEQVARVDADFFGGDKPRQVFEGPAPAFRKDKLDFEESRRDRWFALE